MNSSFLKAVAIAVGLAAATPALAATMPVATVNGIAIPKAYVDVIVRTQTQPGTPDSEELRASITDRLIDIEILAQQAGKKGLGKSPELKAQLEVLRVQALADAYVQDYAKNHPVSDDTAKAAYDKLRSESGDKEYKASHILLDTEGEAKGIIARLKLGEKFEDLARESKDAVSKDKGGALDWNTANGFVKPFSDAMVKLEKGQYTDTPVQSEFGWHVIRLDGIRAAQYPEFDQVKAQIKQSLLQEDVQKTVKALRAEARVEMH